ncbi:MAG: ParB/RepB/Spo0J family partition protein [Vicinamibacterales bacterium]
MEKRPALGKGLSALIPDVPAPAPAAAALELDVDRIEPSEYQPRQHIDDAALEQLSKSIAASGIIQPIVVRQVGPDRYQIIAGERRWRAAQRAGLTRVPVVIKAAPAANRSQLLEWALIENLQREDLNPIEAAAAYQRLSREFALTHDDIAARVGKDRSTIANTIRLLKLPPEVQADVASGALSMGHARAIVSLESDADQRRIAREVTSRNLSVRETESLVKRGPAANPPRPAPPQKDIHTKAAEETLHRALGTRVEIVRKGKGGHVVIGFSSEEELQRLYEYLTDTQR